MNINQSANVLYQWIRFNEPFQTNEKLFSNFGIIIRINLNFFEIIVALGLSSEVGEAFVLISTRSSLRNL